MMMSLMIDDLEANSVPGFWDKQIQRADRLAKPRGSTGKLLEFYAELLRSQKEIYGYFLSGQESLPAGNLEEDLVLIRNSSLPLLRTVAMYGPEPLAAEAQILMNGNRQLLDERLLGYWRSPSDIQFFEKALLQPYTRWLLDTGISLVGRELASGDRACPYCGGQPQLSFLQARESTAESGNRDLMCATCLSAWEFRRVVCANCGEERPAKLGYFHSPEFDHIRIEACDTCKRYIKGVDLTRFGHAMPLVDEIYAAPLDLWAREHGYTKIELNLVGV